MNTHPARLSSWSAPVTRLTVFSALLVGACLAGAQTSPAPLQTVKLRAVAHFDFDRTELTDADRAAMLAEVGQVQDVTWQTIVAVGHTDSTGSEAYNQALAARRAHAVRDYLTSKGLAPSMIATRALGAAKPAAPNDSEQGRAANRRTEIEFTGVRAQR